MYFSPIVIPFWFQFVLLCFLCYCHVIDVCQLPLWCFCFLLFSFCCLFIFRLKYNFWPRTHSYTACRPIKKSIHSYQTCLHIRSNHVEAIYLLVHYRKLLGNYFLLEAFILILLIIPINIKSNTFLILCLESIGSSTLLKLWLRTGEAILLQYSLQKSF